MKCTRIFRIENEDKMIEKIILQFTFNRRNVVIRISRRKIIPVAQKSIKIEMSYKINCRNRVFEFEVDRKSCQTRAE